MIKSHSKPSLKAELDWMTCIIWQMPLTLPIGLWLCLRSFFLNVGDTITKKKQIMGSLQTVSPLLFVLFLQRFVTPKTFTAAHWIFVSLSNGKGCGSQHIRITTSSHLVHSFIFLPVHNPPRLHRYKMQIQVKWTLAATTIYQKCMQFPSRPPPRCKCLRSTNVQYSTAIFQYRSNQ